MHCIFSLFQTGSKFNPEIIQLDLADFDSIVKAAQAALGIHGNIHILINNAGMSYRGEIMDTAMDVQTKLMAVNYFGHIALTKGGYLSSQQFIYVKINVRKLSGEK
jgi:dehydrogenase/reductase SDR family protein 7B